MTRRDQWDGENAGSKEIQFREKEMGIVEALSDARHAFSYCFPVGKKGRPHPGVGGADPTTLQYREKLNGTNFIMLNFEKNLIPEGRLELLNAVWMNSWEGISLKSQSLSCVWM